MIFIYVCSETISDVFSQDDIQHGRRYTFWSMNVEHVSLRLYTCCFAGTHTYQIICYAFVSDGHETTDLLLYWDGEGAVELSDELRLPQFDLVGIDEVPCTKRYHTGAYMLCEHCFG